MKKPKQAKAAKVEEQHPLKQGLKLPCYAGN